jgi:phosphoribosyl-AMP cyclohydrolase
MFSISQIEDDTLERAHDNQGVNYWSAARKTSWFLGRQSCEGLRQHMESLQRLRRMKFKAQSGKTLPLP